MHGNEEAYLLSVVEPREILEGRPCTLAPPLQCTYTHRIKDPIYTQDPIYIQEVDPPLDDALDGDMMVTGARESLPLSTADSTPVAIARRITMG